MEQCLVLDIGGTFVKYAVMTRDGQFVVQGKVPANTADEAGTLASLEAVRDAVAAYEYEGVAISMPGRIDTAAGIAYTGGAFSWVHDYPAAERYGAVFGKPATVANDGKCAAYAESWKGALSDIDSGAVLVLGTGIGGGIVLNGQVWMGATGGAGELSGLLANFDSMRLGFPQGLSGFGPTRSLRQPSPRRTPRAKSWSMRMVSCCSMPTRQATRTRLPCWTSSASKRRRAS